MKTNEQNKTRIIESLRVWIARRPGLDYANYGEPKSYRAEVRGITKDLHHARDMIRAVELSSITGDQLAAAFPRAYSGRLSWDGERLDYCCGQYWPTEYRRAVCAVCASALWDYYREDFAAAKRGKESDGDAIRRKFRQMFGRTIQMRWFD